MKTKTKPKKMAATCLEMIPLKQVRPSAYNPRKTFDADDMARLVASVQREGILQNLVVRCIDSDAKGGPVYEIMAGERRYRAAQEVGLKEIPCRIVAADHQQAKGIALVENIFRSEVPILEKATGVRDYIQDNNLTVDQAAEALGESVGALRALLALKGLPELAAQALQAGRLPLATAGLIASIPPGENQQRLALAVLTGNDNTDPVAEDLDKDYQLLTVKETQELIACKYQRQLKGVPWKLTDKELLEGAPACSTCPQRSGNLAKEDPEKYGALRSDMCLDVGCFMKKRQAVKDAAEREARRQGRNFIVGSTAQDAGNHWSPYLRLDKPNAASSIHLEECKTLREFLQRKGIEPEKIIVAILPDGHTEEVIDRHWLQRELAPKAPSPLPSPQSKERPAKEKPPAAFTIVKPEVQTSAPGEEEEETEPRLLDTMDAEDVAIEAGLSQVCATAAACLRNAVLDERCNKVLQAVALAMCDFELSCGASSQLPHCELGRGVNRQGTHQRTVVLACWEDWIAQAPSADLLILLAELQIRQAFAESWDSSICEKLMALAGTSAAVLMAEAKQQQQPATVAS